MGGAWGGGAGREVSSCRLSKDMEGGNFGFPYCHANGIPDPDIKRPHACAGVIMPAALTGPHAGGLGIKFYTGSIVPPEYPKLAFIAGGGAGKRGPKVRTSAWISAPNGAG